MPKKLMIYPYGKETSAITRHKEMLTYSLTRLVSPISLGYSGKDACIVDGGDDTGFIIDDDFDSCMDDCDSVLFSYEEYIHNIAVYKDKIAKSINAGKEVLLTSKLYSNLSQLLEEYMDSIKVLNERIVSLPKILSSELLPVNVPVILVMGSGQHCSKFDIQLSLRDFFQKAGYKVSQLGSKDYSCLFGFDSIPDFVFSDMNMSNKIFEFNRFVFTKVKSEDPDLLIIGIPNAVLPINNTFTEGFGEAAQIITNAVTSDLAIFSTYFNLYNKQYFDNSLDMCRYRLNSVVEYFNIANTKLSIDMIRKEMSYLTLTSEYIKNNLPTDVTGEAYTVFNALNKTDMDMVCEKIFSSLCDNIEVM